MLGQSLRYGFGTNIAVDQQVAIGLAKEALASEGFGVLCEMDISATLKAKLGVDFPPYVILGACNPPLAHRALLAEPEIGLLLPCNVVVHAGGDPGHSVVMAMDPVAALDLTGNADVRPVAEEVRTRLLRVIRAVEEAA